MTKILNFYQNKTKGEDQIGLSTHMGLVGPGAHFNPIAQMVVTGRLK